MRRWHEDYRISLREWKKHRKNHVEGNMRSSTRIGLDPDEVDCACDEQVGRFRKMDAWDCGVVHCWVCHGNKYPKREKHEHEIRADISFREQMKDFRRGTE